MMKSLAKLRAASSHRPALLAIFALTAMVLHWWHPGSVIMQGDSVYFPSPLVQLQTSLSIWNHTASLVGSYSQTCSYALILVINAALQAIGGYSFGQILFLELLVVGSWIAAFMLARRLGASGWASAAAAWFYAVNPWTEQFYAYNYQLEILAICVPLWVLWLIDVERLGTKRLIMYATLFAAVPASTFGINPALIAIALFSIVPAIPFAIIVNGDGKKTIISFLLTIPFMFLGALWWLVPMVWTDLHSVLTAQTLGLRVELGDGEIIAPQQYALRADVVVEAKLCSI